MAEITTIRRLAGGMLGLALLGCGPQTAPEPAAEPSATPAPASDPAPAPGATGAPAVPPFEAAAAEGVSPTSLERVDLKLAAESANAFGADLHRRLAARGGNVFWSPYSVSAALGMALAGAKGETASEMAAAMHAPAGDAQALVAALGVHQRELDGRAGAGNTLRVANAVWGANDAPFVPAYVERMAAAYGGGLHRLNFAADAEAARGVINGWVSERTNSRIPNLIPAGALSSDTRAVLTNALYFKGTWANQFDPKETKDRSFTVESGSTVSVPTMHREGGFRLSEVEGAQLAAFEYTGGALSMVAILPKKRNGLAELEAGLTGARLRDWVADVRGVEPETDTHCYLPRWKARFATDLVPQLKELGMSACFAGGRADFSGMLEESSIYISLVLHEAFVEVNEEGTEAAAATAVVMERGAPPEAFRADHPFLYAIVENATGAILFLGRCADPSKE